MKQRVLVTLFLILIVVRLAACNNADTPTAVITTPPPEEANYTAASTPAAAVVAPTTATPTLLPPMQVLTATPTSAPPTATLTPILPAPSPTSSTPRIYVVQEYDTLLGIAIEFDTTTEAIAAANNINENDFLQIGQELIIPTNAEATTITSANTVTPSIQANEPTAATETQEPPNSSASLRAGSPTAQPFDSPTPIPQPPPSNLPTISHPANVNPLTGLPVDDPAKLQRRPLMVRVGNDPAARPQVGLNSADMVYEEITEWWVTRFTAIFLSQTPTTVGPVRSARLINVQLVPQYQGALAHSGGSDPVRWEISQVISANLDEFYNPAPYFYRPNEGWQTRLAINAEDARAYMQKKNLDAPVALQGFVFSGTPEGGESGENIFIPYPRVTSLTEWHYDAGSGKYLRWISGDPLYDFNGGQIAAANVIVYFTEHQDTDIVEDTNGAKSIRILVNGRGPAWFFRDGKLTKGYWETDGSRTPYFAYEDGHPYSLKPGNTWVEVVPIYFTIGLNSFDEASAKP